MVSVVAEHTLKRQVATLIVWIFRFCVYAIEIMNVVHWNPSLLNKWIQE